MAEGGHPPFRIEIFEVAGGYRYRLWDADNLPHDNSEVFASEAECLSAADQRRAAAEEAAVRADGDGAPLRIEIVTVVDGFRYRLWDGDNLAHSPSRVFATEAECLSAADLRRAAVHGTATYAPFDAPRSRIEIIKVVGGYRYRLWDADDLPHEPSRVFETEAECLGAADLRRAALEGTVAWAADDDPPFRIEIIKVDAGYRYRLWDADNLPHEPSGVFETEAECWRAAELRRTTTVGSAAGAGDDDDL